MIQKKICMVGASGVGKTSLVQRFVKSIYSEKYHMTIGVKIDKKSLEVNGQEVNLLLWDLQGEDGQNKVRPSFLRGTSGFLLVIDLTRHETLITAFSIQKMVEHEIGDIPYLVLFNKNDLPETFEVSESEVAEMASKYGWETFRTSAKTGEMVEDAFLRLAEKMIAS